MRLWCASSNPGKLAEFRLALDTFGHGRYPVEPLPGINLLAPPEETGSTFEENAAAKALYYGGHGSGLLFADDSGLEVDALGGAPGVHSARFAGPGATDADNNRLLLERLRGVGCRAARFVCVVALVEDGRLLGTFRGSVEGRILEAPRGSNGFGYDPLFFYPPFGCTLAEASREQKLQVSHRGNALAAMIRHLAAIRPGGRE